MLARFHLLLPFVVTVPNGEEFPIAEYTDEGCQVRVYPVALRSDAGKTDPGTDTVLVNDRPTYRADVLRIDFAKPEFDRRDGLAPVVLDPSHVVITRAINFFLTKLRYVTRGGAIRLVSFPWGSWRLEYLADDGTELEKREGLVRKLGAVERSFNFVLLDQTIWNQIHELPPDSTPPPWIELLIDAKTDLPRIGPAMVLAATALEVFISRTLENLAKLRGKEGDLWRWLNARADHLRPTVEEEYDALLKMFSGHSLKEDATLWEQFKNLKTARNEFVHEGVAKLGGVPVTLDTATKLVAGAEAVVEKVRSWLPTELQWPKFEHSYNIRVTSSLT
jgi:hypothetical protein